MLDIVLTGHDLDHQHGPLHELIAALRPQRVLYRPTEPSLRLEGVEENAEGLAALAAEAERHEADYFEVRAGLSIKDFRAFFFDMDSTLIQNECIDDMAAAAGCLEEVRRMTREAMEGHWPFAENLQRRVALLKGQPESVIAHSTESVRITHGAPELMKFAARNGIQCYVVSGGFTNLTRPIAKRLGMTGAVSNELVLKDGCLTGEVRGPAGGKILDADGKRRAVEVLTQLLGASIDQALCCGDGANDLEMIQAAGLGVAFHAKPVVQAKAKLAIRHAGLEAIILLFREAWKDALPIDFPETDAAGAHAQVHMN